MVQLISNLMVASTESQVNSFFLMHSVETCVFGNFTLMFDNFICMFKIFAVSHRFTHVQSSVYC